jgi:hypothetical protein
MDKSPTKEINELAITQVEMIIFNQSTNHFANPTGNFEINSIIKYAYKHARKYN